LEKACHLDYEIYISHIEGTNKFYVGKSKQAKGSEKREDQKIRGTLNEWLKYYNSDKTTNKETKSETKKDLQELYKNGVDLNTWEAVRSLWAHKSVLTLALLERVNEDLGLKTRVAYTPK